LGRWKREKVVLPFHFYGWLFEGEREKKENRGRLKKGKKKGKKKGESIPPRIFLLLSVTDRTKGRGSKGGEREGEKRGEGEGGKRGEGRVRCPITIIDLLMSPKLISGLERGKKERGGGGGGSNIKEKMGRNVQMAQPRLLNLLTNSVKRSEHRKRGKEGKKRKKKAIRTEREKKKTNLLSSLFMTSI